jgi:hypothetical protein
MTLIIRNAQMEALAQDREQQFERRVAAHLRASWPARCAATSDDELVSAVRAASARAAAHGLTRARDVARYIDLAYLVGPDFESEPPWVGEILRSTRYPARKIDEIYRRMKLDEELRAPGSADHV